MKRALSAFALLVSIAAAANAQSVKDLAHRVRGSVVLLTVLDAGGERVSSGTGFAIAPNVLATNFHVIEGARRLRATFGDNTSVEVTGVVAEDEENDLALIRLPGEAALPALTISSSLVEPGDRVIVVGNPLGLAGTVSEGIVGAVRMNGLGEDSPDFSDQPILQITAPISHGSSGSPVVNAAGEVVGVAVAYLGGGQNLNLAIPASLLRALQQAATSGKLIRVFDSTTSRWGLYRNLVVSAVLFGLILLAFRLMKPHETPAPATKTPPPSKIRVPLRRPRGWGES